MTKYRPGSAGEKEEKQFNNVILPFFAILTVLCLLVTFVFDTVIHDNVKAAPTWMNILGGIFLVGSLGFIYKAHKAGEEGAQGYSIAWAISLVIGFLTAAGFYGYTY